MEKKHQKSLPKVHVEFRNHDLFDSFIQFIAASNMNKSIKSTFQYFTKFMNLLAIFFTQKTFNRIPFCFPSSVQFHLLPKKYNKEVNMQNFI